MESGGVRHADVAIVEVGLLDDESGDPLHLGHVEECGAPDLGRVG